MTNKTTIGVGILLVAIVALGILSYTQGWISIGAGEETTREQVAQSPVVIVQPGEPLVQQPVAVPSIALKAVPVETLKAQGKDKFTMANVGAGDYWVKFYHPGADVSDPYIEPLDSINLSGGSGESSNYVIQTQTTYDVYFDGDSGYYDMKLIPKINYNEETGKGFLMIDEQSFIGVAPVGSQVDVDTLPEYQTGINESGTDTFYYDESDLGGSAWFKVDIGNANANSELRQEVMCFTDSDGDMENNEVTSLTATYVSGSTAISIPGTLLTYWQDAMGGASAECVTIANLLGSSQKARWEFTVTVDEANFDAGEEFEICFDDLGDYKAKQYPSRDAKATVECLIIGNQA